MSTWVDIMAYGVDSSDLADAADRLAELEGLWSRFIDSSDVCRLNRSDGQPTTVSCETLHLLDAMVVGVDETAGRFDPTTLPALLNAGYVASVDANGKVTVGTPNTVFQLIEHRAPLLSTMIVDRKQLTVCLPPGLTIDAGGIGKGLAADMVADFLIDRGASGVLVSLGGDLAIRGSTPDDRGWPIQIADPLHPDESVMELAVLGGGVATSSSMKRTWTLDGQRMHHTIDPAAGTPCVTTIAAVTVVGATAATAETHATAALVSGTAEAAASYLERRGLHGVIIATDGAITPTTFLQTHDRSMTNE